jgi:hypothetical protein
MVVTGLSAPEKKRVAERQEGLSSNQLHVFIDPGPRLDALLDDWKV